MKTAYMRNQEIILRALEPEDLELMFRIENEPDIWEISNTTMPYSRYVLKQYIETMHNDVYMDKQLRLVIESRKGGHALGMIDLTDFNPLHSRAEIGIVVKEGCRERGIASQALDLLVEYCFRYLHLHQLYAYIASDNMACRNLFSACNFIECGILPHWLRRECGYQDVVLVHRLSDITFEKPF